MSEMFNGNTLFLKVNCLAMPFSLLSEELVCLKKVYKITLNFLAVRKAYSTETFSLGWFLFVPYVDSLVG